MNGETDLVHCLILTNRAEISFRIASVAITSLEGDGGFLEAEGTPDDCVESEASEAPLCRSGDIAPGTFCHFPVQAPPLDAKNHRSEIVVMAEGLCTDRAPRPCTEVPADRNPTQENPVRVQWDVLSTPLLACWAAGRPTNGNSYWDFELTNMCADETSDPQAASS
ncbi:hypothetical protein [Kineosporia babensis]|uniref:Uncharacterized protein n=1 Tax=Kineosporia babensis TaxID=499548 RepID=A0A9X1NPF6_9ACTN|nr:hypothetical protein [Kineosporia babensis]MCD5317224.1 hypothetical protein [Kineosporia babensis]